MVLGDEKHGAMELANSETSPVLPKKNKENVVGTKGVSTLDEELEQAAQVQEHEQPSQEAPHPNAYTEHGEWD